MILLLIIGIICLLLGFLIGNFIKSSKIKEKNQEIEREEIQAQLRIKELEKDYAEQAKIFALQEAQIKSQNESLILNLKLKQKKLKKYVIKNYQIGSAKNQN